MQILIVLMIFIEYALLLRYELDFAITFGLLFMALYIHMDNEEKQRK